MIDYLAPEDDGLPMRSFGRWTAVKLDYLARYINIFETAMRDKWSSRNFIDLMAGSGKVRIRKSNIILLGSPLLALTTTYPFTGYFFCDISATNITTLDRRCQSSPIYNRVSLWKGDCNQVVNDIVASIKSDDRHSLNLAFLDPDGFDLYWKTVAQLASLRHMDLIIYYPQMGVKRYMQTAYQSDTITPVDLYFGSGEWRKIFEKFHDKHGLQKELIELYKSQLSTLGYTEIFSGDEDMGNEPLIRNQLRNAPLYRLIFASKHKLGHEFWRKVIRRDVFGQQRLF